ncbi:hypothetical protein M422DRAFT_274447 [Sphaerobolus stellatus SS14]|uniref:Uncharacterized protein n=1 Tax=Sphaerobolus stellatus (strain SS14) TaxID=990650 RepID=A0A0C9T6Y8_SPHS4|nr:hypothetical protein M422DRAFT_274447 [Sphaerobolus stellatus SS14]
MSCSNQDTSNVSSHNSLRRLCWEYKADSDQSVHKCACHEEPNPLSSEGTGDGEEEEEDTSGNNKDNYGFTGKWFITPARNFSCLHDMWTPMLEILEIGKLNNHQLTEADYSKSVWWKITLYRALIKAIPELHKCAKALGVSLVDLASLRSDARNEDVQCIKDNSQLLQLKSKAFHPPLIMNDKITQGYHHPQIARLVCPITWLDQFDSDGAFRQKLRDGIVRPTSNDLPLFIFDEATFSMDNLFESFLHSNLLAWRMIFIGPKATFDGVPAPRQGGKGNAAKNCVKHMTVGTLAYLMTIVYFALRSDTTFHAGGGESFDYAEFYRSLTMTMTKDASPEQLKDLLIWWDWKVFPNNVDEFSEDDDIETGISTMTSGCGLLKAQLHMAALADSTNKQ